MRINVPADNVNAHGQRFDHNRSNAAARIDGPNAFGLRNGNVGRGPGYPRTERDGVAARLLHMMKPYGGAFLVTAKVPTPAHGYKSEPVVRLVHVRLSFNMHPHLSFDRAALIILDFVVAGEVVRFHEDDFKCVSIQFDLFYLLQNILKLVPLVHYIDALPYEGTAAGVNLGGALQQVGLRHKSEEGPHLKMTQ
ncbi:hypothetical protein D3C72_1555430 [compost metagenome]